MANNSSFSATQIISVVAGNLVLQHRFVDFEGSMSDQPNQVLGVSAIETEVNSLLPVITLGTAIIEVSEMINKGDKVCSTTNGKAKKAGVNDKVNGRAITSSSGVGFITILLTP